MVREKIVLVVHLSQLAWGLLLALSLAVVVVVIFSFRG